MSIFSERRILDRWPWFGTFGDKRLGCEAITILNNLPAEKIPLLDALGRAELERAVGVHLFCICTEKPLIDAYFEAIAAERGLVTMTAEDVLAEISVVLMQAAASIKAGRIQRVLPVTNYGR